MEICWDLHKGWLTNNNVAEDSQMGWGLFVQAVLILLSTCTINFSEMNVKYSVYGL